MQKKHFFLWIASCLPLFCEALILQTSHIADVIPLIDADTWVLVDLDNTTFESKQALGHIDWISDALGQKTKQGLSVSEAREEFYPTWVLVQESCPVKPVEGAFIPSLSLLQEQGIVIMGLTHRQPSLVNATLKQISSLGFDFLKTAPFKFSFSTKLQGPALYQEGILFAGEYNKKGETFLKFLSIIEQKPKKVLFIDDRKEYVEEVESALLAKGIEYTGVHYTAIEEVEKVYSREIAEIQHAFFHKILSNEEALLLMQSLK